MTKHRKDGIKRISDFTDSQIKEALEHCNSEKIHTPGSIQPHSYMFVMDIDCSNFIYVSDNVGLFLEITNQEVLANPVHHVFARDTLDEIKANSQTTVLNQTSTQQITLKGKVYDGISHRTENTIILELEPKDEDSISADLKVLAHLELFCSEVRKINTIKQLHLKFAKHIRAITGFDRVKIYQFDQSWNGAVIAEDKEVYMESYLGLNFPASDIPDQARELYKKNLIRLIVDSNYCPVPLISAESAKQNKLDMSYCGTRSVSPVHLQYLKNMDVGASMSVSIMYKNELWGLVACHHSLAKFVSYKIRLLCEVVTHMYSARLATLSEEIALRSSRTQLSLIEQITIRASEQSATSLLSELQKSSTEALGADGLIIFSGDNIQTYGELPDEQGVELINQWCSTLDLSRVYTTDDLRSSLNASGVSSEISGGVLIIPIGFQKDHFACWYRKPIVHNVYWAGNPEKSAKLTEAGYRLTPRGSFDLWQTEISHKSSAWELQSVYTAESIVEIILDSERRQAEELSKAKTHFLSQMSHELRTPLTAMSSIVQILKEEKSLLEPIKTLIATLDASSQSLMALIDDLLDLDRVESEAVDLEVFEFRPQDVIEEVRSAMAVQASNKSLALNIQYGQGESSPILADPVKIRQVLYNLVGNSIKFTDVGIITLFCSLISSDNEHYDLILQVSDTGVGIPETKIDDVFDRFVQADSSISRKFGGSGLGLSISKSLVELMGGEITVTSKEGLGTKFKVIIPVKLSESDANGDNQIPICEDSAKVETASAPINQKIKRLLLVEDYEANIVAMVYYLQSRGYSTLIAHNGEQAIELMEQQEFDLVIMDVQMPVMDGITATKIIREKQQLGQLPETPILGMTAHALKEDMQECLDAGMDDYISKPLKLSQLIKKMNGLMQ